MNSLIDRGLIECKGRLDVPGRPMLYGTTADFLRSFGISSIEDLPKPGEEISEAFAKTKLSNTEEELNAEQLEILPADIDSAEKPALDEQTQAELISSIQEDDGPSAEDDIVEDPI